MIQSLINKRVQRSFSRASGNYDELTNFHKTIALKLIGKVQNIKTADKILDVGMGTGFFTEKLSWMLPESKVIGVDFSYEMIEAARKKGSGIIGVQADACSLPFHAETFDVIVSNLAYQWVEDLRKAFGEAQRVLDENGTIVFTAFGYETFKEVFCSLEKNLPLSLKNGKLPIKRLHKNEEIQDALKSAGFKNINIRAENINVRFKDLFDLLNWSKSIGANALDRNMFIGKDLLKRANKYFLENFSDEKSALSTFQIIWVEAQK